MNSYFVTGTDTDCGKTYVTALMIKAARSAGIDAVGAKPFCCGPRDDVEILAAAADHAEPPDAINPVWLKTPAAPLACQLLGEPAADIPGALAAIRLLAARHTQVFCEGAGGWLVPIAEGRTIADFATELGWPVIVVVRNKLGALNHTLLTLDSIRARGARVAGLILNHPDVLDDGTRKTNRAILGKACGCPILAEIASGQSALPAPVT